MIVFYSFCILDLASRVAFFVVSCFEAQLSRALIEIQGFSTVASMAAGVSHSHNLSQLMFNLAQCATLEHEAQDKFSLRNKRRLVNIILLAWTVMILAYLCCEVFANDTEALAIYLLVLYSLLGAQLLIVNFILLH